MRRLAVANGPNIFRMLLVVKVIVPRRNWTRLIEMVDALHLNYSASGYVFRNNYFFLDLPPSADNETSSNVTFVQHQLKVYHTHSTHAQLVGRLLLSVPRINEMIASATDRLLLLYRLL